MADDESVYVAFYNEIKKERGISQLDYMLYLLRRISVLVAVADNELVRSIGDYVERVLISCGHDFTGADGIEGRVDEFVTPTSDFYPPDQNYYFSFYFLLAIITVRFVKNPSDGEFECFCENYQMFVETAASEFGDQMLDLDKKEIVDHFSRHTERNEVFERFATFLKDSGN